MGVSSDINQSNQPYADGPYAGCCRTSAYVNICNDFCEQFLQIGWYKGAWDLGQCSDHYDGMRVFVEKWQSFVLHTCVIYLEPSPNVAYSYLIKKTTDMGGGAYVYEAWWNGEIVTSYVIDSDGIPLGLTGAGEQLDHDSSNLPTISSKLDVLRRFDFNGNQLLWTDHITSGSPECNNKYNIDKETEYRFITTGPFYPSWICE